MIYCNKQTIFYNKRVNVILIHYKKVKINNNYNIIINYLSSKINIIKIKFNNCMNIIKIITKIQLSNKLKA
jgi:hypothetical protein